MKKLFTIFLTVAFALSVAGMAIAEEKKSDAAKPAAPTAKSAEPAKKAKAQFVTGTIESIDPAAGTLTVKGRKGPVELKAGEKVKLDGFKQGDKVTVKYSEGNALSVKKVTGKKAKADKKDEMKKEGAAPAAPAEKK